MSTSPPPTDTTAKPGTSAGRGGLSARGVRVQAGGQTLVRSVDIDVRPGELCAIIGASGAGKSTLVRVLAGVNAPSAGEITVDGEHIDFATDSVGYVPTGDLVHPQLTVREALGYAAALRAHDVPAREREARVEAVLEELHMTHRGDAQVRSLSDGERRRVACGTELVGDPSVVVLDEPTSGLDPGLERRLMLLLRELADRGRAVLVTTHATGSLRLCDRIIVMASGGRVAFVGSHDETLAHFGATTIDEVYAAVEDSDDSRDVVAGPTGHAASGGATTTSNASQARRKAPPVSRQIRTLSSRYALCMRRDARSLALMIGQAPVIGIAIGLTVPANILSDPTAGGYYGVLLAFMIVIGAVWLGLIAACREVARERDALLREAAVGVRLDAYLLSKCVVIFPLVAFQTVLLVVPVAVLQPPAGDITQYAGVLAMAIVGAWGAAAIGLLVSVLVQNAGQATTVLPLVVIPQLLLSGALIPTAKMIVPVRALSDITLARWVESGIGNSFKLETALDSGSSGSITDFTGLQPSFFGQGLVLPILMAALLTAVTLIFTAIVLDRRVINAIYDEYDLLDEGPGGGQAVRPVASPA
ncbi:ATP-binding cassette domain-containing protein [Patulibacter minatonensis]|uniref:ABC transporter ATP-binding protein/permease n=1 Tax=Patulibacter minatonensis TaxID=298163 RepID=UPI0004799716|nr:ATP-binding cassette domain-containing protein [Patulibacter minatonensis]